MDSEYVRSPMGEDYHRAELRELAYEWHGGQFSPLYAFASSGTVVAGLASEANACARADKCDALDADKLAAIASLEPESAE